MQSLLIALVCPRSHLGNIKKVRNTNSGLAVCTVSLSQTGHAPCNANFKTGWKHAYFCWKGLMCDSVGTHSLLPLLGAGGTAGWCCIIIQLKGNLNIIVTFQGLRSFPSRAHPVSLAARLADPPHRPRPRSVPSSQVLFFYKSGAG